MLPPLLCVLCHVCGPGAATAADPNLGGQQGRLAVRRCCTFPLQPCTPLPPLLRSCLQSWWPTSPWSSPPMPARQPTSPRWQGDTHGGLSRCLQPGSGGAMPARVRASPCPSCYTCPTCTQCLWHFSRCGALMAQRQAVQGHPARLVEGSFKHWQGHASSGHKDWKRWMGGAAQQRSTWGKQCMRVEGVAVWHVLKGQPKRLQCWGTTSSIATYRWLAGPTL